jgi:ubiquinone/menaquinone biosynthesis C-methylase UbiE
MRIPRGLALKVHFVLDQLVPPLLRDSKWFMLPPYKLLFGDKADFVMEFRDRATVDDVKFVAAYKEVIPSLLVNRETDLNTESLQQILDSVVGPTVLEVGCGKGFLLKKLAARWNATGADIVIDRSHFADVPGIKLTEANIQQLPFADRQFDTLVCTHTLEHVRDFFAAVSELRRVAKRRLIIVVPKQRPYKYSLDWHLHFFPYKDSLLAMLGWPKTGVCAESGGDLFYYEER